VGTAIRDSAIMREASRLAADGELGNSDAIRLLQIPHRTEDVQDVLRAFDRQLSREARSKLTLDALVPPPPDVDNQRYEPLFDKYIITGKTYTTASGAVVPNELQYFNGEMAHFYGECSNVALVNAALAGSGYRPITLKYADGRNAAVAQIWSNKFTDTSLQPYAAMFIAVAAVADDAPESQASIRADSNGASSALVMLDGSFDPATVVYENRARMFMVRLLDTTQVAIDVGRERMGTDKRPGTIDLVRGGRRLRVSIKDKAGRGAVQADLELSSDPAVYGPTVAQAATTAGITLQGLPRGTECVYPNVARIGQAPVVRWQWRSDVTPRLQPIMPGTVVFDPGSEEGQILLAWGFTPKVLGYFPKVRGVITGLADQMPRQARVRPPTASQTPRALAENAPLLRAAFPREPGKVAGLLPVLRLVGQELSPRFGGSIGAPAYEAHPRTEGVDAVRSRALGEVVSAQSRWAWDARFLGSFRALFRKELVGETPDGLRINWLVTEGALAGPGLDAVVLPGAVDWMRIRRDGIGIVNVHACLETRDHVRIYCTYGGIVDLGPDGYARVLHDDCDQLAPVVVTPTCSTADPRLEWLNRAQCIGVGRVDVRALRIEFDLYLLKVGQRTDQAVAGEN
jgi:hypothetical protein